MNKKLVFTIGCLTGGIITIIACAIIFSGLLYLSNIRNNPNGSGVDPVTSESCPVAGDYSITDILAPIRKKYKLPAIAGVIVTDKGITSIGVVGVRKAGIDIPVTLNDKWHLGSDTKAMTATLVAKLVEKDQIKWDTTVGDVFKDIAHSLHPEMKKLTLLHLLSHRAGLPENTDLAKFNGKNGPKERLQVVIYELAKAPQFKPGSKKQYSNLGYIVVGAMIEKIAKKPWAQKMQDELFTPLEMNSVGFGGTGTPGKVNQPWGHTDDGRPVYGNGPSVDNPAVMGPAGRVHCTIQDWAKFIQDQLRGANGETALLKKKAYTTLHTPPFGGDYALGWIVTKRDCGGGTILTHCGSNTMNFANVWIAPQRNFAVLICINQGGNIAFKASDEAIGALIKLHNVQTENETSPNK